MEDHGSIVGSIMTTDLVTVSPDTPVIDVSRLMLEKEVRCILVCDNKTSLQGIVTDSDLVFSVAGRLDEVLRGPISQIMTADPVTIDPDADIYEAVAIMSDRGFRRVPVVSDSKVVGIISIRDIVRSILANLQDYKTIA